MAFGDHTDTYVPEKKVAPRRLSEFQQKLLDTVIDEFNGDVTAAAKATGHKKPWDLINSVKKELAELAETVFARYAVRAALKTGEIMDSDVPVKGADAKLKAAQMILERTNPKTDKVDITGQINGGLVILPNKKTQADE